MSSSSSKRVRKISIHALLAESDHRSAGLPDHPHRFQSTLSLRRATRVHHGLLPGGDISIHALLAESDVANPCVLSSYLTISIHALLAESDRFRYTAKTDSYDFNPRSPCGERPVDLCIVPEVHGFQSTLSLRRATYRSWVISGPSTQFQSTLSLRRATAGLAFGHFIVPISIHALLAESDLEPHKIIDDELVISIHALLAESDKGGSLACKTDPRFQSTLSLRRATGFFFLFRFLRRRFQSTLSLRRATLGTVPTPFKPVISIHALLAESDVNAAINTSDLNFKISIHALLAESDHQRWVCHRPPGHFNPRSPCGERPQPR